ncbi:hypothetical protein [Natronincola ferrireducens]|nr:hypothetical protein [Natronincola ferrireducens]
MLEYLEKQIGTATRIELLGSEEADVSDGKMIFVNTDDSVGNLVSKEGMVVSKIRNSNLSDLSVEFSISGKNVRVKMEASDGHTIQKEIFPQNTTNIIGTVGNTYSYLKVIPVTTY